MELNITEGFIVESLRKIKEGHLKWVIETFNEEGKLKITTYKCGTIIRIDIKEE